ncbi:hypothetical protein F7725_021677 [Dissostichus mawsoni]|uniref:Fructose-2,6-bisphosphatase TIGAR B n=1 Tax=Dissostichus mawsoni TaxID=36200 RepID=A0A7J5ZFZ6_DISMA|nr:hypothetical protein F7725_021677 [Dissostichus mawsoni]
MSETGVQQAEAVGKYLRDIAFNYVFSSNLQRAIHTASLGGYKCIESVIDDNCFPQTAEIIRRNNTHCSGTEMVLDPLLRERGFGVAEGHPKEHLKNMANAAGQSCRDYTPPGGETLDQVKLRFKKFLKALFQQLSDEHGRAGAPEAANGTAAAASERAPGGSAEDGLQEASVHALVVSHGAYIRVAIKHILEDLKSSLPAGAKMSQVFSPCPNTGISRFVFTLSPSESGPVLSAARCCFTNRKEHLGNLTAAEKCGGKEMG